MGCCFSCFCFSCCQQNNSKEIKNFALKFPHGKSYQTFLSSSWKIEKDINQWIRENLFGWGQTKTWAHGLVYNDQPPVDLHVHGETKGETKGKGHCKGILVWNESRIGWLCHSVPRFPSKMNESSISEIEPSEYEYGQSFQFMEFPFDDFLLNQILGQICFMEAHVYLTFSFDFSAFKHTNKHHSPTTTTCNEIQITPTIRHIAKPPHWEKDIYSCYLAVHFPFSWKVESWIRGHRISLPTQIHPYTHLVQDINAWKGCDERIVGENQDHSKWAVANKKYYFIGDLNRMTTQFQRGGGGFLCQDPQLCVALNRAIYNPDKGR
jgi:deoxyribonuclease-2